MRVWRKSNDDAAAKNEEEEEAGEEQNEEKEATAGEEDEAKEAESEEKPAAEVSAKLYRSTIYRAEDDKNKKPNKPAIPDEQPNTLREKLALEAARSGQGRPIMGDMNDEPRLIAHYGPGKWGKMEYSHEAPPDRPGVGTPKPKKIVIHWFRSASSGKNVEFKFKVREK